MRSVGSISPEHASKILSDKPIGTLQQVVLPYYSPADYRRISKSLLLHEHPFDYGQIETIDGQLYVSAQLLNRPKRWNKDTQAKEDIATLIQATRVTLAKAKGYLHRQQQPVHK